MTLFKALLVCGLASLAACSGGESSQAIVPPPPPPPPPPPASATVQQVFTQLPALAQPVALKQAPGDSTRWFAVEKSGSIQAFANSAGANSTSLFVDISAQVNSNFSESGLLGMAFHPSWPGTPEVYLSYTATGPGGGNPLISRVSRLTSIDGGQSLLAASEEILLTVIQDDTNHNGGDLAFGQDGFLYASFGDGGGGGDQNENAQNDANLLGTIVRIDVDGAAPYDIPVDNPNFGNDLCLQGFGTAACPEIYAWGLRNPWRISFDSVTGDLWVGDVGQGAFEEVDRIEIGMNYGWNDREGANCFDPPAACRTAGLAEPVTEYGRALGGSITGGYVYRGTAIAGLVGQYVFADFVSGRIFSVPATSQPTVAPTVLQDTGLQFAFSAFAEDIDGEIYLVHYSGSIYQLMASP
jgi:glucose/arabinose dehydrogenase